MCKISVDGLFIRSLLIAFYFKLFPDIIRDGRLFIAEPPLYRVDDKKNPFVINKEDYIRRYVEAVSKEYQIGWHDTTNDNITWFNKGEVQEFLDRTAGYVDEMARISNHYKCNERLIEMIFEEIAFHGPEDDPQKRSKMIDVNSMMNNITAEFPEIFYDDKERLIRGVIDGKYQLIEISESLVKRGMKMIDLIMVWGLRPEVRHILRNKKTGQQQSFSMLGVLKLLRRYQPNILHRFKGLGENDDDDIKTTIMDPNTRTLIRVNIGDIENDMKIFQILRGNSPADAQARKEMMRAYKIPPELIDT